MNQPAICLAVVTNLNWLIHIIDGADADFAERI